MRTVKTVHCKINNLCKIVIKLLSLDHIRMTRTKFKKAPHIFNDNVVYLVEMGFPHYNKKIWQINLHCCEKKRGNK